MSSLGELQSTFAERCFLRYYSLSLFKNKIKLETPHQNLRSMLKYRILKHSKGIILIVILKPSCLTSAALGGGALHENQYHHPT